MDVTAGHLVAGMMAVLAPTALTGAGIFERHHFEE